MKQIIIEAVLLGVILGVILEVIRFFAISASFWPFGAFWWELSSMQFFSAFRRFLLVAASRVVFTTKWTLPSRWRGFALVLLKDTILQQSFEK